MVQTMPGRKKGKRGATKQLDQKEQEQQDRRKILVMELWNGVDEYKNELLNAIQNSKDGARKIYALALSSLPVEVQNMTMEEALETNVFEDLEQQQENFKVDSSTVLSKFINKKNIQAKSTTKAQLPATKKKLSTVKRKSVAGRKFSSGIRKSRMLPSQPCIKHQSNNSGNDSYVDVSDEDTVFETPQTQPRTTRITGPITPKFDPSKPVPRSLLRRARPGEVAVSLSGSPLLIEDPTGESRARAQSENLKVSIGTKTYHFSELQKSSGRPELKERRKILELQRTLANMLKK